MAFTLLNFFVILPFPHFSHTGFDLREIFSPYVSYSIFTTQKPYMEGQAINVR